MNTSVDVDPGDCHCDSLKKIIRWFLGELLGNYHLPKSEIDKIHFFYKSSVFRYPAQECRLEFRMLHESLKLMKCWADEQIKDGSSADKLRLEDMEGILNRISNKLPHGVDKVEADKLGNINFSLNSSLLKQPITTWALEEIKDRTCHNKSFKVIIGMTNASSSGEHQSLLEFRKILVAQSISTICKKLGQTIDNEHFAAVPDGALAHNLVLITAKSFDHCEDTKQVGIEEEAEFSNPDVVLQLNIGSIIAKRPTQNACPSLNELVNQRLSEIKDISESRRSEVQLSPAWVPSVYDLAKTTIHYDVLQKPTGTDVILLPLEANHMNHDALFIMYNFARILSILNRFEEQVKREEYPPLPDLSQIDFNKIGEANEEMELLQLLLEWPRILESVINFVRFESNLFVIPKFILALAKAFNRVYFNVVVLVPTNAPHNFPAMMARIYFLKSIRIVFEDCLEIMQINPKS